MQNKSKEEKYSAATGFLYSQLPMFSRVGAAAYKPGLETSERLDEFFNHPHKKFKSIHVGGTNGKGSTSHLIASVLQSQGYKTGLYTSPHLVDFRERMRINGKMIPKEKVIEFVEKWKSLDYEGRQSFFELTMMMAFNWFAEEKVDYAVIEVGMGGRLDSTNIITPILSVITNISHDHNQFLGETLRAIAGEKAGIIKPKVDVVIGERQEEICDIFIEKAKTMESELTFASERFKDLPIIANNEGGWIIKYPKGEICFPLGGDYQKKNLKTALAAIDKLKEKGLEISEQAIKAGFEDVCRQTGLSGRWMVITENPLTIADTGHNQAGLEHNFSQLKTLMAGRKEGRLRIVIGFVADKAIGKILDLLPKDAVYYTTNAAIPRALPAGELQKLMVTSGLESREFKTVSEAYRETQKEASKEDLIFIGGSTFIVADLLADLQKR